MQYFSKKKIVVFAAVLAIGGLALLVVSYLYQLVGPDQLQIYSLRFLALLTLLSFVAMAGASLGRFEPETTPVQLEPEQ